MAGAVQWTIDQLWSGVQSLYTQLKQIETNLNTDKTELTALYSYAKKEYDPAGAYDRAMLEPLIHRNSVLRLSYLAPLKAKYTQAASLASAALKSAGYTTPGLSGMGAVVAIAPAAAVVIVVAALAAVASLAILTQSQRSRTAAIRDVMGDTSTTAEQKVALTKSLKDAIAEENKGNPLQVGWIVPALGIVALIVLAPQVMRMLSSRKAATA